MRLFLDSSILLAACGSARGASREIFGRASNHGWTLLTSFYVIKEVIINLPSLGPAAVKEWSLLWPALALEDDVVTLDRIAVFEPAKDRPILFTALAWADVLLTLDRADFGALLGKNFYDLLILTPGMFLERQRAAGHLK